LEDEMTAFVPCPACGGPVHPIASRCKHCKADLLQLRQQAAQAARAARMGAPAAPAMAHNPAAMRQTSKASPPPVDARRDATPAPVTTEPRAPSPSRLAPPPVVVYAQPSAWARRWPIAVSVVAVAAIAVSLVLLLRDDGEAEPARFRSGSQAPHNIPDNMPAPNMNGPNSPHGRLDPQPFPDPADPGAPGKKWSSAPEPGMFVVAVTQTVCAKLQDCGMRDDLSSALCDALSSGVGDPSIDAKVQNGECHYDRVAADSCLSAIGRMSCDAGGGDVTQLIEEGMKLLDCSSTIVCR
jgi:hypothetical protein